jgi:dihydrofolate reductase
MRQAGHDVARAGRDVASPNLGRRCLRRTRVLSRTATKLAGSSDWSAKSPAGSPLSMDTVFLLGGDGDSGRAQHPRQGNGRSGARAHVRSFGSGRRSGQAVVGVVSTDLPDPENASAQIRGSPEIPSPSGVDRFLCAAARVELCMTEMNSRRLVQSALVSLNGVTSEPLTWAGPFFGPGSAARSLAVLKASGAMLMGRRTYEIFSRQWPSTPGEYAGYLNAMPKYVFSSTLQRAEWTNTTVAPGDVAEAVTSLKQADGQDLIVYGHGQFGQTLCDAGLVDELNLTVVPVFVQAGTTMYRPGGSAHAWQLVSAGPGADPGLAALTYQPAQLSADDAP